MKWSFRKYTTGNLIFENSNNCQDKCCQINRTNPGLNTLSFRSKDNCNEYPPVVLVVIHRELPAVAKLARSEADLFGSMSGEVLTKTEAIATEVSGAGTSPHDMSFFAMSCPMGTISWRFSS